MAKVIDPLDNQDLNLQEDEELVNLFQDASDGNLIRADIMA